jgi:formate hydrogenlyase transcriptional activator
MLEAVNGQTLAAPEADLLHSQYQALLAISEAIAVHRDLNELFHDLAQRLPRIVSSDFINLVLHDPTREVMRLHALVAPESSTIRPGLEFPMDETSSGLVLKTQQPFMVEDVAAESRFPKLMPLLRENGVQSYCTVPLTTALRRLGAMTFGSLQRRVYQEAEINFMQQVAKQVAVAVDNVLHDESARSGQEQLTHERDRMRLLLEVNNAVVSHLALEDLFAAVSACLRKVIQHDGAALCLYDEATRRYRVQVLHFANNESFIEEGRVESDSCAKLPCGTAITTRKPAVFREEDLTNLCSESPKAQHLVGEGVKAFCSVPLLSHDRALGTLDVGRRHADTFSPEDVELLSGVAKQIAIAVENALNFKQAQSVQQQLREQHDRLKLLLDVNNRVVSALDLHALLKAVSASLRSLVPHEYASISLYDPETERLQIHALDFPVSKGLLGQGLRIPIKGAVHGRALTSGQPVFMTRRSIEQSDSDLARRFLAEGLRSGCILPLISHGRPLGTLAVASLREEAFPRKDAELLQHVANQIAMAVENAIAFGQVVDRANKLTEEKLYLQDEIRAEHNFEEIIGEGTGLKRILEQVEIAAPTDSTVLIQGETGTGKELIARAIHSLSTRREHTLVKVNCAAIPTGLLESELFGHEKGAFTGAITQRIGRFELAHRGTIFLDEVGDIPQELQPKLLRVLQEQEFERLGSTRTIHVDVRMVAATNADLAQKVAENQFRSDLYYRLNVFPVTIPPLRERRKDIPLLVRHFAQKYALRMKKPIETIPTVAMSALVDYHWPGNVRELENLIERAVILSRGPELEIPLSEFKRQTKAASVDFSSSPSTLEEAEREHILRALGDTHWILGGPAGAALKLGMKRTTLQSKMRKLGIVRPQ